MSCRVSSTLPLSTREDAEDYAAPAYTEYAVRMLRFRQMDLEYALWLIANLCISPHMAFRSAYACSMPDTLCGCC